MDDFEHFCIICKGPDANKKKLIKNKEKVEDLQHCCTERFSLGDASVEFVIKRMQSIHDLGKISYHNECRKPFVNKDKIRRWKEKAQTMKEGKFQKGRPSISNEVTRSKRAKITPLEKKCIFQTCKFCPQDTKAVSVVLSNVIGLRLLDIKNNTTDDQVRSCVAELNEFGDARAREKCYHSVCIISAQRTMVRRVNLSSTNVKPFCDDQLICCVQYTLQDDNTSMDMNQVNEAYIIILERFNVVVNESRNYKKYLKQLISEKLPDVSFIATSNPHKAEQLILKKGVSEAVTSYHDMLGDDGLLNYLKIAASVLRQEALNHPKWSATDGFHSFNNPSLLQYFLKSLLFGKKFHVQGIRQNETEKVVDTACQFVLQNTRSDRQVAHQSSTDSCFRNTVDTPLSIGIPLAVHAKHRDKDLVCMLNNAYLGSDYRKIITYEKLLEQGVLQRMKESGGYCLPCFVKKDVNLWFAIDNIDVLVDTVTGQHTFHGTVLVLNQRDEEGEDVSQPLVIPEKMPECPVSFNIPYMPEPVIKLDPIRFSESVFDGRNENAQGQVSNVWFLSNYFLSTSKEACTTFSDASQTHQPSEAIAEFETSSPPGQIKRSPGVSRSGEFEFLPTWAATNSMLLANTPEKLTCRTNTGVVAPLLKCPPTDLSTLYTALMRAQGISAVVVGPHRRTIITLDLDLYYRAIQIQQSVKNSNWIIQAGYLHIMFAALHALGKTIDGSGLDSCVVENGVYTYAALRGIYNGKSYKRGVEHHLTNALSIMMMKLDAFFLNYADENIRAQVVRFKQSLYG